MVSDLSGEGFWRAAGLAPAFQRRNCSAPSSAPHAANNTGASARARTGGGVAEETVNGC